MAIDVIVEPSRPITPDPERNFKRRVLRPDTREMKSVERDRLRHCRLFRERCLRINELDDRRASIFRSAGG
jgi:hypothetical protein